MTKLSLTHMTKNRDAATRGDLVASCVPLRS
jgi:hypothetical protein